MARIRNVKPAFFRHADLFDAEKAANLPLRLAYVGLWTCCDVNGVFPWRPRELKLDILPHDVLDFADVLDALLRHHFIRKFMDGETAYGQVPTLKKHQHFVGKEAKSSGTYPLPDTGEVTGKFPGTSREVLINGDLDRSGDPEISGGARLPDCPGLDSTAWSLWLDYRKRSGKPLKPVSIPAAQRKLSAFGTNQHVVVEQSIANGWQGLFPPKDDSVSRGTQTKTKFARAMEALDRA